MIKVMEGVRVLEVAQFTFVPAAGAILADWGADVIKVEHPVRGDTQRGFINMGGFGEVLPRYENAVSIDPNVKDAWGIPVLKFDYNFGDNEKKMAEDMAVTAKEMFEAAGIEIIGVDRELLTPGWSIHELGTSRMGNDPKTSVLNQFQQSHDVKNLFVVDGSSHVNASCQNPTWTIMALAWRSCDHLADELRKGNL